MQLHGVTVRNVRVLRGPNLFAYKPVLQITLDIGPYEEQGSDSFPGFVERLTEWLPGLWKHECSVGRPGGFVERHRRGIYLVHMSEHITLELQNLMGFDVGYGRARGTGECGVYNVVIAYQEEEPAKAAFETALRLTLAAMHDEPFDVAAELDRLHDLADDYRLGPSTAAIVAAARARKIPVLRLTSMGSLVQLGYGVYQKRIMASETSNTSAIAVDMCQEKPLTNRMLRAVAVPVPEGRAVQSADEAWEVAQDIGLPVVVKPESGNQGKGVGVNLRSEAEVRAGYEIASSYRGDVLVEQYVEGEDYRLLVINGQMVAAAWSAGLNPAMIVRAFTTFPSDGALVPGRFNVTEFHSVQVVVDYGHNPAALRALREGVAALGPRKTVMALALPSDRRDEDLMASIEATISYVDEYVLYDLDDRRGRAEGEVIELLARRLPAGVPWEPAIHQHEALLKAWQRVRPGDRLVFIVDVVDERLESMKTLAKWVSEDATCVAPISAKAN